GKAMLFATEGINFMYYRQKPVIKEVEPNSVADRAGIQAGDEITAVNGQPTEFWNEFTKVVRASPGKELQITLIRNGREERTTLTVPEESRIGVAVEIDDLSVTDE